MSDYVPITCTDYRSWGGNQVIDKPPPIVEPPENYVELLEDLRNNEKIYYWSNDELFVGKDVGIFIPEKNFLKLEPSTLSETKVVRFLEVDIRQGETEEDLLTQVTALKAYSDTVEYAAQLTYGDLYKGKSLKPFQLFDGKLLACKNPSEFGITHAEYCWNFETDTSTVWEFIPRPKDPLEINARFNTLLTMYITKFDGFKASARSINFVDLHLVVVKHFLQGERWHYYRGVIIPREFWNQFNENPAGVVEGTYGVYFIDKGIFLLVLKFRIRPLPGVFSEIGPMAIRCSLKYVSPIEEIEDEWSELATTFMKAALSNETLLIEAFHEGYSFLESKFLRIPLPVEVYIRPKQEFDEAGTKGISLSDLLVGLKLSEISPVSLFEKCPRPLALMLCPGESYSNDAEKSKIDQQISAVSTLRL